MTTDLTPSIQSKNQSTPTSSLARNGSIVITRPRAQLLSLLDQLDEQIQAHGLNSGTYALCPLPLLEIECALPLESIENLHRSMVKADLLIFVSPNAVLMTYKLLRDAGLTWPAEKVIGLIGGGSESTLLDLKIQAEKIIKPQNPDKWDAAGLQEELQAHFLNWKKQRVVFIRGQGGRHALIDYIQEQEALLEVYEVYRRVPLDTNDFFWLSIQDQLIEANKANFLQQPWLWLLTSSEAVKTIPDAFKSLNIPLDILASFHALCSHPNIAKAAQEVGFGKIHQCLPGDEQLVAATILWLKNISK